MSARDSGPHETRRLGPERDTGAGPDPDERQRAAHGQALLRSWLGEAGHGRAAALCRLHEVWTEVVGPRLADHVRPSALTEQVLVLSVDSPVWAQELTFLKGALMARIRELTGLVVREVRTLSEIPPAPRVRP